MKKRVISLFIAASMVAVLFTGCGGDSGDRSSAEASEYLTEEYTADSDFSSESYSFDEEIGDINDALDSIKTADLPEEEIEAVNEEMEGAEVSSDAVEGEATVETEDGLNSSTETTSVDSTDTVEESKTATSSRKIVYTADITIATKEFDKDISSIKSMVKKCGGYFESSSLSGTELAQNRSANYTIRIPAENYDTFMDSVGSVEVITSKEENAEDITSSYVDVQARLKSLKLKKSRLEQFEAQATRLEDILDFEDQINDVQYEIEHYTGLLNTYKDMTSNCTINISIDETQEYIEPEPEEPDTFAKQVKETFLSSIAAFVAIIEGIIIVLVYVLPFAIVAGVITIIVLKARKNKPKKVKAEKKSGSNQTIAVDNSDTNKKEEVGTNRSYAGPAYKNDNGEQK